MKLIIGLGNIGDKYFETRHNVGFIVLDRYASLNKFEYKFDKDLEAFIAIVNVNGNKTIFAKPTTYMNLSGNAAAKIIKYYKINIEDVLVIYDDVDLECGRVRVRETNGHGGHNGIRSIIDTLGSKDFKRIRIGIGIDKTMPLDHYVLGKFKKEEIPLLRAVVDESVNIIDEFISEKYFKDIMTKYNTQT
ncbi:MAG: aminoacyl-tRNA hydrolase [Acholeplasma sp.]|nr:aminoacyl-tRNA hydrolase [Acholeplasma sp.]